MVRRTRISKEYRDMQQEYFDITHLTPPSYNKQSPRSTGNSVQTGRPVKRATTGGKLTKALPVLEMEIKKPATAKKRSSNLL